jgi:hypothetical protein
MQMGLKEQRTLQVQLAVVETGLGGVADATNVFAPANLACAIITAIDKDHLKALGRPIRVINLLHVRSSRFSTFVHSLRLLIS